MNLELVPVCPDWAVRMHDMMSFKLIPMWNKKKCYGLRDKRCDLPWGVPHLRTWIPSLWHGGSGACTCPVPLTLKCSDGFGHCLSVNIQRGVRFYLLVLGIKVVIMNHITRSKNIYNIFPFYFNNRNKRKHPSHRMWSQSFMTSGCNLHCRPDPSLAVSASLCSRVYVWLTSECSPHCILISALHKIVD